MKNLFNRIMFKLGYVPAKTQVTNIHINSVVTYHPCEKMSLEEMKEKVSCALMEALGDCSRLPIN